MQEFVLTLMEVSARSVEAPGFVWKQGLVPVGDDAAVIERLMGSRDWLVQLSVWRDVDALKAFVYRDDGHAAAFRRRKDWVEPTPDANYALWWVGAGQYPTPDEAFARLTTIRERGATADAFTFGRAFPPPAP